VKTGVRKQCVRREREIQSETRLKNYEHGWKRRELRYQVGKRKKKKELVE